MAATVVIFGASGDLTTRKLIPALYQLSRRGRLPPDTRIVGFSRTSFSHDAWREALTESTKEFASSSFDDESWSKFSQQLYYRPGDIGDGASFAALSRFLDELDGETATRIYYLATAPRFYEPTVAALGENRLAVEDRGPRRLVVEKPFGVDRKSANHLNTAIHHVFAESQVYRIDHYLGKETVQNLVVLRFANSIFEPIWNRNYIDHVQITVAEEVDVGSRGEYYDTAGVLRDMFQNHLLQLLSITAMEPPIRFDAEQVRNEKVKVLRAIRPFDARDVATETLRGQYRGYRNAAGVAPDSQTATYAAIKLNVDNWRWQGVPFYLRSGKAMSCRTTQIVIQFRHPPHMMFHKAGADIREANRLVIQVQPAEGIQLHFLTKVPDAEMKLLFTDLDFSFRREFHGHLPEAYERLLLEVIEGEASLFTRADEAESAWGIIDPILAAWEQTGQPPLHVYEPGLWGSEECCDWMRKQGREWFDTCPVLK